MALPAAYLYELERERQLWDFAEGIVNIAFIDTIPHMVHYALW